jgi:hypothetical protein
VNAIPPGWYEDPWRQAALRWWDGTTWTEHTSEYSPVHATRAAIHQPSPADLFERERRITPWLRGLLFLWPIATALSLGGLVSTFKRVLDNEPSDALGGAWVLAQLGSLVGLGVLVLRILWLYRAAMTARALGLDARREPLHAAIGWLIPVLNYWWPYQGMTDLFPEGQRPDRRIAWWWGMSIASGLSLFVVIAVPFVSSGAAVTLVLVALLPALVAAALEVGLVSDAVAVHERLV